MELEGLEILIISVERWKLDAERAENLGAKFAAGIR
jgi:hypothetical protein